MPMNLKSQKEYRGINVFLQMTIAAETRLRAYEIAALVAHFRSRLMRSRWKAPHPTFEWSRRAIIPGHGN
jgi:hypothetical protein